MPPFHAVPAGGERLWLLPQKAVFLPDHATLLVADVHIGKAAAFRRLGVPVPGGTTADTLARLDALVRHWAPAQLVVLGDFLHSRSGRAPATLARLQAWRDAHPALALTLVRGNHDAHAGDPPASLGMRVVDEPLPLGGLALCHAPDAQAPGYVVGGHWHPCVNVGRGFERMRLPCFCIGQRRAVLPAFGAFTGMHPAPRDAGDRLYAVLDEQVVALP